MIAALGPTIALSRKANDHVALTPSVDDSGKIVPLGGVDANPKRIMEASKLRPRFHLIDGDTLETESFSFSWSAQRRNAENVIMIWHNPNLAGIYAKQFRALWSESAD